MILVTGATGTIGVELIKELSRRGVFVRALVRDRMRSRRVSLPGVELVDGDFDLPETLPAALEGVDELFLLVPSSSRAEVQQLQFIDAAKRNGVKHIVKLSQLGAALNSPGRFQRCHAVVEDYIRESGFAYTFLRPNLFMQRLLDSRSGISSQGVFYAAAGTAKISAIDARDIAAAAAQVLTEYGHEGETYELTGPEALSYTQMADILSQATGMLIRCVDLPLDAFQHSLLDRGVPKWQANGLVEESAIYRCGGAADVTNAVFNVTGSASRTFSDFAFDYSAVFYPRAVPVT